MSEIVVLEKPELERMLRDILGERAVPETSEVMTLAEAADYFGKSKQAITNWTRLELHPLPCGYLGSDPVFYRSEVVKWSKENARRKLALQKS